MRAVSPSENPEGERTAMEEEFRRVFGEGTKEVVERERVEVEFFFFFLAAGVSIFLSRTPSFPSFVPSLAIFRFLASLPSPLPPQQPWPRRSAREACEAPPARSASPPPR